MGRQFRPSIMKVKINLRRFKFLNYKMTDSLGWWKNINLNLGQNLIRTTTKKIK